MERISYLETGESVTAGTYVLFQNRQPVSGIEGIRYASADPSVATISDTGVIQAVAPGNTVIKAFDFGDSGPGIGDNEQMYYLASRYGKPEFAQF